MRPEILVVLFIVLSALALTAYLFSRAVRKKTGLPEGKMLYSDTGAWKKVEKPYFDPEWRLAGKPDYVIESKGMLIPVEVKSNSTDTPYDSHIMQLAAYCRLVQVVSGRRPSSGLIKYRNRVFEIEYSPALEANLKSLIQEVRSTDPSLEVPRSHHSAARCRSCGYNLNCEQRLESGR